MTIFLGCGFAAKYREGGGNFSVPLQWMLGLKRLKQDAIWLEILPTAGNPREDQLKVQNFQRQLRLHGLAGRYCLLLQNPASERHDLASMRCIGMSKKALLDRLAGPSTLLNLSYSIHPPFLFNFERRIFCDLDPSEIIFWMTKMELGQSTHHEFWTIGLNAGAADCRLPILPGMKWRTFFPLADTHFLKAQPRPRATKFTTIGQWYWDGAVEVDGQFPDLSKRAAFEQYLELPARFPKARFELAMNLGRDEPERARLRRHGWSVVDPHKVVPTPQAYRRYLKSAVGEFTAIKGADVTWRTGWLSDRAAAFLAMGRPVITEDTGAGKYLPEATGISFVRDLAGATGTVQRVLGDWKRYSKLARASAVEVFDASKNLRKILGISE